MTQTYDRLATTLGADRETQVDADEARRRTIRLTDLETCNNSFIDFRTPVSDQKENYSLIGNGVSQNANQFINLSIPHGFNVGGAAMPNGVTNSLHMHFTAEVFVIVKGSYTFRWGRDGEEGEYVASPGDIITVPTWIYRGFTNTGPDENFMFTFLGQDDTGGILWGPSVLKEAEGYGLYLTEDNQLIDTVAGDMVPEGVRLIEPMPDFEISKLRHYSVEEMRRRVTSNADREFFDDALLCTAVPGGHARLALVIGFGITEHRFQEPRVYNPHGFSLAAVRAEPGEGVLLHTHAETQVLMVTGGEWEVTLNETDPVSVRLGLHDTFSVPQGAWRSWRNVSDDPEAEILVATRGDGRVPLTWAPEIVAAAHRADVAYDANGYLAPQSVVSRTAVDD